MIRTGSFYIVGLLMLALPSVVAASAALQCHALFDDGLAHPAPFIGLSLTYSPVLQFNGQRRSFPDQVLLETSRIDTTAAPTQALINYANDLTGIQPYGKKLFHDAGLAAIYQNYGPRVPVETVTMVKVVESTLALDRQATFLVSSAPTAGSSDVKGYMRLFDGSLYVGGIRQTSSSALPLERILARQNKSTSVVKQKRAEGYDVIEIGKYFLSETLNPTDLKLVKKSVLTWLLDQVESRGTEYLANTYYFAHVASRAHQISYERYWKFKTVDRELSKGLDPEENILMIRADDLVAQLHKLIEQQK